MSHESLDLGFLSSSSSSTLDVFISRMGGKPMWLVPNNLPDVVCPCCKSREAMALLTQIYAPIDDFQRAFHRVLYVFLCKKNQCHRNNHAPFVVMRCQLARSNNFYPFSLSPSSKLPRFELDVCEVCGLKGDKKCGQCGKVAYCGREHQKLHWPHHKLLCRRKDNDVLATPNSTPRKPLKFLLPERELIIEPAEPQDCPHYFDEDEDFDEEEDHLDEDLLKKYETSNLSTSALAQFAKEGKGLVRFKQVVAHSPEQVVRYERRGQPLWMDDDHNDKNDDNEEKDEKKMSENWFSTRVEDLPKCDYCGGKRVFEFQVMPQLLALLDLGLDVDFGVLAIFTCEQSCVQGEAVYRTEAVIRQRLSNDDDDKERSGSEQE